MKTEQISHCEWNCQW